MLTREDIRHHLLMSGLDLTRCWLTAGGALVFHGLRQATEDIDMGCRPERRRPPAFSFGRWYRYFGKLGGRYVTVMGGIPVVSLADVLALKLQLGREKDRADIAAIKKTLAESKLRNTCG